MKFYLFLTVVLLPNNLPYFDGPNSLIPRRELWVQNLQVVKLFLLIFNFSALLSQNLLWCFNKLSLAAFIPRRWTIFSGSLWSPNLIPFCFICCPRKSFYHFSLLAVSAHFWPLFFLIPRRGELACTLSGSQFDDLSFLYPPPRKLFWVSVYKRYLLIFDLWNCFFLGGWTNGYGPPMGSQFDLFLFYIWSS